MQVASNLIANLVDDAAQYTPETGHSSVAVTSEGDELLFEVRDTGVGIPAERARRRGTAESSASTVLGGARKLFHGSVAHATCRENDLIKVRPVRTLSVLTDACVSSTKSASRTGRSERLALITAANFFP